VAGKQLDVTDPFEPIEKQEEEKDAPKRNIVGAETAPGLSEYLESPGISDGSTIDTDPVADDAVSGLVEWDPVFISNRILSFCEQLTGLRGFKFYKYQREFGYRIIYSIVTNDGEEITSLWSRQSGKTELVCDVVVGLMILLPKLANIFPKQLGHFEGGFWVGIFAPRTWQVQTDEERVAARLRSKPTQEIMRDRDIGIERVKKFELSNGSKLFSHTANPQTFIESKTLHLVIIDEAQDADKMVVLKSIHPMVAAVNGTIIKIGTPAPKRCEFLEAILRNRRKTRERKGAHRRLHFEYDYRIVQYHNKLYKKFIAKEKSRSGEDSDYFQMSYCLAWILERGMFTTPVDLDRIEDRKREMVISFPAHFGRQYQLLQTVAGLDVGKSQDSSVLTIALPRMETKNAEGFFNIEVLSWFEWLGDNYESQYYEIVSILREARVKFLAIDSTGVGDAVSDRFIANLPDVNIIPVVFSTTSKSDLYKLLSRELKAARLSIPASRDCRKRRAYRRFRLQMEELEKDWRGSAMVVNAPKDDPEAHDDYPDSLALAVHAAYYDVSPEIETSRYSITKLGSRGKNMFLR
jgi:hypothetical protein